MSRGGTCVCVWGGGGGLVYAMHETSLMRTVAARSTLADVHVTNSF